MHKYTFGFVINDKMKFYSYADTSSFPLISLDEHVMFDRMDENINLNLHTKHDNITHNPCYELRYFYEQCN